MDQLCRLLSHDRGTQDGPVWAVYPPTNAIVPVGSMALKRPLPYFSIFHPPRKGGLLATLSKHLPFHWIVGIDELFRNQTWFRTLTNELVYDLISSLPCNTQDSHGQLAIGGDTQLIHILVSIPRVLL